MCAGKHASLGISVRGNNKLGETRIPATPEYFQFSVNCTFGFEDMFSLLFSYQQTRRDKQTQQTGN